MASGWHWYNALGDADFWDDVRVGMLSRTGDSVNQVTAPIVDTISKPLKPVAITAAAVAVTAFVFRKPILKALK